MHIESVKDNDTAQIEECIATKELHDEEAGHISKELEGLLELRSILSSELAMCQEEVNFLGSPFDNYSSD